MKYKKIPKNFTENLILKQFEIIGVEKSIEELKKEPTWFSDYTFTKEQQTEFREHLKCEIKKVRGSKYFKESYYNGFILNYELKTIL